MPIEIRELVIRAIVDAAQHDPEAEAHGDENRAKLVQQCVDEVLKALRRRQER
jgi:hypothetical protein